MKKITFAAVMVLGTLALAKQNPADVNLTAHIISVEFSPTPSGIYMNMNNGSVQMPSGTSGNWFTEIQIGNKVYTASDRCKAAKTGSDYPARLKKEKLELLAGDKVCKYNITSTREVGGR